MKYLWAWQMTEWNFKDQVKIFRHKLIENFVLFSQTSLS